MANGDDNNDIPGDVCLDDIPEQPSRFIPDPSFPVKSALLDDTALKNVLKEALKQGALDDILDNAGNLLPEPDGADNRVNNPPQGDDVPFIPCPDGDCPPGFECVDGVCVPAQGAGSFRAADPHERNQPARNANGARDFSVRVPVAFDQ